MAKLAFSKLNKIKNVSDKIISIGDNDIILKQYLPLADKLELIIAVIEQAGNGEEGFFNLVKLEAFYRIEMVKRYTNISFTDKQLEDIPKLYDALILNNIWNTIISEIPEQEQEYIWNNILSMAKEITTYNNSILGILKSISQNYDQLNLDATEIQKKIGDPENLALLKAMVNKTGLVN